MIKKLIIFGLLFIILLSIFGVSNQNMKQKVIQTVNSMKECVQKADHIKDKVLQDETKYAEIQRGNHKVVVEKINVKHIPNMVMVNKTRFVSCEWSLSCILGFRRETYQEEEQQGTIEIYDEKVVGYKVNDKIVDKYGERVACYINPEDSDQEICYAYDDGFNENINDKWKTECKSGTSCFVRQISTGKVINVQTDIGLLN